MTVTYEPLKDLTTQQLDKILEKFQLISRHHDAAEKIKIIKCIGLYDSKLGQIPDEDILVGFNGNGNLHDIKSKDDTVKLMENESLCNTCNKKVDKKDIGMRCEGCTQFFHNKCTSSPVTKAVFDIIVTTPQWVQVFCPKCMNAPKKAEEDLKEIKQTMEEIKEKVTVTKSYSNAVTQAANKQIGNNLNKLVNHLNKEKKEANTEEEKDKQERIIIVKKYSDKNVKSSRDVRKQVNKEFPGAVIRNARTTAGGSILLELDDKESADRIAANWKDTLFGGNNGIMRGNKPRKAGIIKHVYSDRTEEQIEEEISGQYKDCEVEFFKRDQRFTGTIKVKFSSEEELNQAMQNRLDIFEQKYRVERYIFKPRVIMCRKCQKYGHLDRVCHRENPVCGKCKSSEHHTDNCTVEDGQFKCYHCDGKHQAGSRSCLVQQAKEEEINTRFHHG